LSQTESKVNERNLFIQLFLRQQPSLSNSDRKKQMSTDQPNEYDVLCGKDKTFSKHKGNIVFREKIMSMASEYKIASTKPARMKLTKVIVDSLKSEYNAKFLRSIPTSNDTYLWEEISDQQARDKTSHALRFALGKEGPSKKATAPSSSASRRRQSHRRRTISTVMEAGDTSVDDDRKVKSSSIKTIGRDKRSYRELISPASAPAEVLSSSSLAPIKSIPYATIASAPTKMPSRRRHRRSNSDDSSETTVVTADSDDVSTTEYLTSLGDDDDVSQTLQNEIEVLYCDNHQHTFIIDNDEDNYMNYPYSSVLVPDYNYHNRDTYADNAPSVRYHLQGVRSSPARLGSPPSSVYYREKSESSQESTRKIAASNKVVQQQPIGWTIDRLDLSVRDSDLNDFLDEEITNDWENQNEDENVNT
jgi:hypothetical protein